MGVPEPATNPDSLDLAYEAALAAAALAHKRGTGAIGPVCGADDQLVARMSVLSALAHYHSAKILATSGAYGHAVALLVLAIEEYGKAVAYRFYSLGVASRDPRDEGRRPFIEERILRCHECKQTVAFFNVFGRQVLPLAGYNDDWFDRASEGISMEALAEEPSLIDRVIPRFTTETKERFLARLKEAPEERDRLVRSAREFTELNDLKLRGFYVDHAGSVTHLPQELGPEIYEEVRAKVVSVVADSIPLIGGEPPAEIAAALAHLKDVPLPPVSFRCPHRRPARDPVAGQAPGNLNGDQPPTPGSR